METWFKVKVPDGLDAMGVTTRILAAFWAASVQPNGKGAALYINDSHDFKKPDPEIYYYFSPRAAELCWPLIQELGGVSCPRPLRSQVSEIADPFGVLQTEESQTDSEPESESD